MTADANREALRRRREAWSWRRGFLLTAIRVAERDFRAAEDTGDPEEIRQAEDRVFAAREELAAHDRSEP